MPSAKEVRSLVTLIESASTARVLNLARRAATRRDGGPADRRLFRTAALDRAIVLKHRLRPHERDWFVSPKAVATKLLIPIDPTDMNCGAHAVLFGQKGCEETLVRTLGIDRDPDAGARDRAVLAALDDLPSLDPFLTREHLKRRGFTVADDYFDISVADVERMHAFVCKDIVPLVTLCFGAGADARMADRLSQKILGAELDATMEPLRLTLKMTDDQFAEGVFCWKGFLYYKWVLDGVLKGAQHMSRALSDVKVQGKATQDEASYINSARDRIRTGVKAACREVRDSLLTYDAAFESLTARADPVAFRDFLLAAPGLFFDVGEKLGAVQHISSFWSFRVGPKATAMPAPEIYDIFMDFEASLGTSSASQDGGAWAA